VRRHVVNTTKNQRTKSNVDGEQRPEKLPLSVSSYSEDTRTRNKHHHRTMADRAEGQTVQV